MARGQFQIQPADLLTETEQNSVKKNTNNRVNFVSIMSFCSNTKRTKIWPYQLLQLELVTVEILAKEFVSG